MEGEGSSSGSDSGSSSRIISGGSDSCIVTTAVHQ